MYKRLILILLFIPISIYANGIWLNSQDIRGGIFGLDEQPISNYTFQNKVFFNNFTYFNYNVGIKISIPQAVLDVNGNVYSRYEIQDIDSNFTLINKEYLNKKLIELDDVIDRIPNDFIVTNISDAELGVEVLSNEVFLDGFILARINVSGDGNVKIMCNGRIWTDNCIIRNGDSIQLKMISANDYEISRFAKLFVESNQVNWEVKTRPEKECRPFSSVNNYMLHPNGGTGVRWDNQYINYNSNNHAIVYSTVKDGYKYYYNPPVIYYGGWNAYGICREKVT